MAIQPRQMLVASNKYNIKCPYAMSAEAITVHNTANDASANNEISYMRNNDSTTSFHFAIDDKEVVQGIPLDRNAFHAGDGATGYGNRKTIGIEICYSKSGGAKFDAAEKLAAKFIAQLLKERNWTIDRVGTHQSRSGKYCPHRTLDYGWQRFLDMISAEMKPAKKNIDWRDVKETWGELDNAPLIDLQTGKELKRLNGGITYVQMTADGKWGRTAWSRDRSLDNAFAIADVKVPVEEEKPAEPAFVKKKWVDVMPIEAVIQGSVDLVNVNTGEVIKRISGDFTYVQVTEDQEYARTDYSRDNDLDNGVLLSRLTPKEVQGSPNEVENEPDNDEDGQGDAVEPIVIKLEEEHVNWLVKVLQAIINFLTGKNK